MIASEPVARSLSDWSVSPFASLSVASAWSPASIIAFRLVQGCFGALLIPQGFSILLRTFPREQLGRVFGLFGPLLALSSISGPVLAAGLLQVAPFGLGRRAVFAVNGIFGVALVMLATIVLPADGGDRTVRIAVMSSCLIVTGLLALLGSIIDGGTSGWGRLQLLLLFAGSACWPPSPSNSAAEPSRCWHPVSSTSEALSLA